MARVRYPEDVEPDGSDEKKNTWWKGGCFSTLGDVSDSLMSSVPDLADDKDNYGEWLENVEHEDALKAFKACEVEP